MSEHIIITQFWYFCNFIAQKTNKMESKNIENNDDIYNFGDEKVSMGKHLILLLDELKHIEGVAKIKRKIASEIASLQKVYS